MDLITLLLLMSMMGGKGKSNPLMMLLLLMMMGGSSGQSMALSTTAGQMPINLGNALVWGMMPKMGTFPALMSGGLDAVLGQSLFKPTTRRRRVYRRRSYRRRYF